MPPDIVPVAEHRAFRGSSSGAKFKRCETAVTLLVLLSSLLTACGESSVPRRFHTVKRLVDERYRTPETSSSGAVPTAVVGGERRPVLSSVQAVRLNPERIPVSPGRRMTINLPIPAAMQGLPLRLRASLEASGAAIAGQRPTFLPSAPSEVGIELLLSEVTGRTPGSVVVFGRSGAPETRYETEAFDVPAKARLRFGIGVDDDEWSPAMPAIRFTVTVVGDRDETSVFQATLDPGRNPDHRRWSNHRVDLARYSGRHVRLRFENAPDDPTVSSPVGFALWGDPAVLAPEPAGERRRDVVLISVDTLRADHLGCYGYGRPTSPAIDGRLAAAGTLFESAFAPAPWTFPSTAAMLSGIYACESRLFPPGRREPLGRLPPETMTLAAALRANGYATAAFTEDGWVSAETGFQRGFGTFVERKAYSGPREPTGAAEATLHDALTWIREHGHRPWFVFAHTYQVHHPYTPPLGYLESVAPAHGEDRGAAEAAAYDAEIRYTDDLISTFLAGLDVAGHGDALVVLTSDHGEQFGEHGLYQHGNSLYDVLLHVPLIVRAPGLVPAGKRIAMPVGLLDVVPTVLELLGLPVPGQVEGRSLVPLLNDHELARIPLFAELTGSIAARDSGWKWIIDREGTHADAFDVAADPAETTNLNPSEAVSDATRALLTDFLNRCGGLRVPPAPNDDQVDPAVREKLKALGYVN
jgi:arylsulfatase A-like enzyme